MGGSGGVRRKWAALGRAVDAHGNMRHGNFVLFKKGKAAHSRSVGQLLELVGHGGCREHGQYQLRGAPVTGGKAEVEELPADS